MFAQSERVALAQEPVGEVIHGVDEGLPFALGEGSVGAVKEHLVDGKLEVVFVLMGDVDDIAVGIFFPVVVNHVGIFEIAYESFGFGVEHGHLPDVERLAVFGGQLCGAGKVVRAFRVIEEGIMVGLLIERETHIGGSYLIDAEHVAVGEGCPVGRGSDDAVFINIKVEGRLGDWQFGVNGVVAYRGEIGDGAFHSHDIALLGLPHEVEEGGAFEIAFPLEFEVLHRVNPMAVLALGRGDCRDEKQREEE